MLKYTYYGHACCLLDDGTHKILTDPFLTDNPLAAIKPEAVECDFILLSHAHFDHIGDAAAIAKRTGATVIATPEILSEKQFENNIGMNVGGTVKLPFGFVRMVPAIHSAGVAGSVACGFVISLGGKTVYFAGDTALFSDMQLIGEKDEIDCALLPIGDHFTMGPADAALAAKFLKAKNVIPIHYNTWPPIAQDPEKFKKLAEKMANTVVKIVKSGESTEL